MNLPTSRSEAQAKSAMKYDTGKLCKNGHSGPRYTLSGVCALCLKASQERMNEAYRSSLDPLRHERKRFAKTTRVANWRVPAHEVDALTAIVSSLLSCRFPDLVGHADLTVMPRPREERGGTVRVDFLLHTDDARAVQLICDDALARFGLDHVQRARLEHLP